jgi:hypothetical protein
MPVQAPSGFSNDPERRALPPLRSLARRIRLTSPRRRVLLAEAVWRLAIARIALLLVPFRSLAARFGEVHTPDQARGAVPQNHSAAELQVAVEIGWAVTRAARYVPFRAVCLPQAIAAMTMLDRRQVRSTMHFGVAKKPDGPMDAHAWLSVGAVEVTGYPVREDFVEVACFL